MEQEEFLARVKQIRESIEHIEALQLSLGVPDQGLESNIHSIQEDINHLTCDVEAEIENPNSWLANSPYICQIPALRNKLHKTRASYLVIESKWRKKHENIDGMGMTAGQIEPAEAAPPAVQLDVFAVRNPNTLLVIQTDTLVVQNHST